MTLVRTLLTIGLAASQTAILSADIIATEPPDAGGQPFSANYITGVPGENIAQIRGRVANAGGADMWAFYIINPALFSAQALNCGACTLANPQLFLLDSLGRGVYQNDDRSGSNVLPRLPAGHANGPTTPGLYFLGISSFDHDPRSATGRIFSNNATGVHGPNGPGGADPMSGYAGSGSSTGVYRIELAGASAIPEPATGMLLIGAAAAFAIVRRRLR